MNLELNNKKTLLVGLGILGGGVATANFLIKNGANLTITDLKKKDDLHDSLSQIQGKFNLTLGEHKESDFKENEIIVFNSALPYHSPWKTLAKKNKKAMENDYTLFGKYLAGQGRKIDIGITGTRGKTTVSSWIHHFITNSILGGNIPNQGLLEIVGKEGKAFVLELSSAQLEFVKKTTPSPHIALITNLYADHLNRYKNIKEYMNIKMNIFKNQTPKDYLIFNKDNKYTKYFLKKKPKSLVYFISTQELPLKLNGLCLNKADEIVFQENKKRTKIIKMPEHLPEHKKNNLLFAMLAAFLHLKDWQSIVEKIPSLPEIPYRQQVIYNDGKNLVINDSASTMPEATMVAIDSFVRNNCELLLITGGTDKNLNFSKLADKIKRNVKKENLFLIAGSGTKKLIQELEKKDYLRDIGDLQIFDSLPKLVLVLKENLDPFACNIILFSPGAASFELFKNEFDRGEQFGKIIINIFNQNYHEYRKCGAIPTPA